MKTECNKCGGVLLWATKFKKYGLYCSNPSCKNKNKRVDPRG